MTRDDAIAWCKQEVAKYEKTLLESVIHKCGNVDCDNWIVRTKVRYCCPECQIPSILEQKRKWWNKHRAAMKVQQKTKSLNLREASKLLGHKVSID